ncbi:ArsR family transcriptional regulator [Fontimonas sp. SYSU GA230001]|uniref:ArsR/SmtB family transcription factor n=1 Tax=Fontimonas sp. SYSU GA230001 TaxID=3142450 RepID=UPI0032B61015
MKKRELKNLLYEQVARIGRAVASPRRLELLELLAQGEKTVETLAQELSVDIKLTSAHLKALREARLVATRRNGKHVVYRLSGSDVADLWVRLREVAETHLLEMGAALAQIAAHPAELTPTSRKALLDRARRGEVVLIDVRPKAEYDTAHLPHARSMPLSELERRMTELPKDREVVAYCRGPFCLLADEALKLLARRGYRARKITDGVSEWRAAGLRLDTSLAAAGGVA